MTKIKPMHALRYEKSDLKDLLCPPYDIINQEMQNDLYARDNHNVIRLEWGKVNDSDTENNSRYTRAKATMEEWIADGTLLIDEAAGFYPHSQKFSFEGKEFVREGFFAAVELTPFDEGKVLPHEWTLSGPKVDRQKLMQTALCSFSPVFGLYDGNSEIGAIIKQATKNAPLAQADGNGFNEILWKVEDKEQIKKLEEAFLDLEILIADGHHRYETTLALRDYMRELKNRNDEKCGYNYVFMLLVDINDPGLLVLPTHRCLKVDEMLKKSFLDVVSKMFKVEELGEVSDKQIEQTLLSHVDEHAFVCYMDKKYFLLTAPATKTEEGLPIIDVVALQKYINDPLFALGKDNSVEGNISYTIHINEAIKRVDTGEASIAVFLNTTPLSDVLENAKAGVRMPQKSTYFYPKVPTGLIMNKLDVDVD